MMFKMQLAALLLIHILIPSVESSGINFFDQAIKLMEESPLLDTHIDLPQIIRSLSNICQYLPQKSLTVIQIDGHLMHSLD